MKKILLTAMVLMGLASCQEPNVNTKNTEYKIGAFGKELEVVTIEGCEYFLMQYDRSMSMCHKGNCSNPIHKIKY